MTHDERLEAAHWFWYAAALEDAALDDVVPASGNNLMNDDGTETLSVESRSRGRVAVATIDASELRRVANGLSDAQLSAFREHIRDAEAAAFPIVRDVAEQAIAKQRKPYEGQAAKKARRQLEAYKLHDAGQSVRYIARTLGIDRTTVQRYLRERGTGAD